MSQEQNSPESQIASQPGSQPGSHPDIQPDMQFDDIDLMQFVDGELDEVTGAALDAYLEGAESAESAEDPAWLKIRALDQMNDTVRSYLELEADAAEPQLDAMWEVIAARVESAEPATSAVTEERSRASADERVGWWAAIVRFFEGYRGHILTGAVAAGAAAAIILAIRPPTTKEVIVERPVTIRSVPEGPTRSIPSVDGSARAANDAVAQPEVTLVADEPTPPQIEQLEVNGGSGTVFVMPSEGEDDVSATVIFIDFDEAEGPIL